MNVAKSEAKMLKAISLADNAGFEGTADALREMLSDFEVAVFERRSIRNDQTEKQADFIHKSAHP